MVKSFRNRSRNYPSLFLIAISLLFLNSELLAATETLESSVLRFELNTSPYSYRVIERSTGKVLLSQSSTGVTFGPELYPASEAANVRNRQTACRPNSGCSLPVGRACPRERPPRPR